LATQTTRRSYLKKRGAVYWLKLAVPRRLQQIIGKERIEESLRVTDLARANELKHGRIDHWRKEFRRMEQSPPLPPHLRDAEEARNAIRAAKDDAEIDALDAAASAHADALEAEEPGKGAAFARVAFRGGEATIREAFDKFIADGEHTPGTVTNYRATFDEFMRHLRDPLARPQSVTRAVAEGYVDWLNREAISKRGRLLDYRTKVERVRRLAHLWKELEARHLVPHGANPWRGHKITGKRKIERDGAEGMRREHSDGEILRILQGVPMGKGTVQTPEFMRDLYALGFYTGMRLDEICSRTLGDIELRGKGYIVHIRRSKTKAGIRSLPVVHAVPVAIFKRYVGKRTDPKAQLFAHLTRGGPDNKLSKNIENAMARYRVRLGLPRGVTFHSTRSNFQTRLYDLGVNRDWVSAYVGHQLPALAKVYVGSIPDALRNVAKVIKYSPPVEKAMRVAQ
jgi:integrase